MDGTGTGTGTNAGTELSGGARPRPAVAVFQTDHIGQLRGRRLEQHGVLKGRHAVAGKRHEVDGLPRLEVELLKGVLVPADLDPQTKATPSLVPA